MTAIVDFHSHFFSRTFFETLAGQSPQDGDVEDKLARVAETTGLVIPEPDTEAHTGRWIAEMHAHGVERTEVVDGVDPHAIQAGNVGNEGVGDDLVTLRAHDPSGAAQWMQALAWPDGTNPWATGARASDSGLYELIWAYQGYGAVVRSFRLYIGREICE